ncbi:DAHL domain-containing protein [Pseudomonas sp.]|jgi:signal transduction histidine kinase|uniref:DAHL domain-containing protein n=1 Tax=Pseudomonas sp. TaxID=306 RepID=UPI002EDB330B
MRRPSTVVRQLVLAAIALALVLGLSYLYARSQTDTSESYTQSRDLVRQIKQLNAQWETEILKSRIALTHDYDRLVFPLAEIQRLWVQLTELLGDPKGPDAVRWRADRDGFVQAIGEKARLVEQFKSHNAVLRNSLTFLATAEDDIQLQFAQLHPGERLRLQNIATDTYDVLLSCLEFSQATTDTKAAEVLLGLNQLAINKQVLPAGFLPAMENLSNHVALILREQPLVNDLLARITALPVAGQLDRVNALLDQDQQRVDTTNQRYHTYLQIFSIIAVCLLAFLGKRLLHSYQVINRVNEDLQAANEGLEQRVETRTRELKDAQAELLDAARQSGMAEIATNVLHNVGNILNSVNVSAEMVTRQVRNSKSAGLEKAMQLINAHGADLGRFFSEDPKGRLVPGYLNQLVEAMTAERQSVIDELHHLSTSVDHIKEIVATQQSYAGVANLVEPVHIVDLMEDALRINSGALHRQQVDIRRDFEQVPVIVADKHRLLLIMVNLISNARFAMTGTSEKVRALTLGIHVLDRAWLQVSVKDDGEGITPANMARLFTHGFTTRKEGHGFGLHSCALAAVEMKGRLTAHSDGPGAGATFTLEIPLITDAGEA